MSEASHDAIIVGARCAGASLAIHLARAGLRVLVVEASTLGTDQTTSTHLIHHVGMGLLDELGVGDGVRALAPPIRAYRFGWGERSLACVAGEARAGRCLQRQHLDGLLQDAARRAGAELRDRCRVTGILHDGRVSGIELRDGRRSERLRARIVIGADGRRSTVARLVGAAEYAGYDGPRAAYWAYWPRPAGWSPNELYQGYDGDALRFVLPANDDLLLVGTAPRLSIARTWRGEHAAAFLRDVRAAPKWGALLEGREPVGPIRRALALRYFFRVAAGPGWALVGDAGHHKDFALARGITDALRDARALAAAIVEDREVALARYWRRRDVESIASFRAGEDLGATGRRRRLERAVFTELAAERQVARILLGMALSLAPPYPVLPPGPLVRCWGHGLRHGDVRLFGELLARGLRVLRVWGEQRRSERRLAALARP